METVNQNSIDIETDKRYSLYANYASQSCNYPDRILSGDNFQKLFNSWVHKNCDSEEFHRKNPDSPCVRIDYGIASNLGNY